VTGAVIQVDDGDTVDIRTGDGEVEVRLAGINAPESGECFGLEATDRLRSLVAGETVAIEATGVDQFDRTLAYLTLGDTLVNLEMVMHGSAIATTPDGGDPYGSALLAAEEEAFSARLGLWADDACGATGPTPAVTVEVAFDPPGPDQGSLGEEWVELGSVEPVDVGGWTVRDESSAHRCVVPAGTTIGPDHPYRVTSDDLCWTPGGSPVWNNDGDIALVLDEDGRVVARHRYRAR
jgi:endonuclease YncB( thermonuclease family)